VVFLDHTLLLSSILTTAKKPTPQSFPQYVPNHKDNEEHSPQPKEETPPSPIDSRGSEGAVIVKTPSPPAGK
jgi:hypothetical protein